MKPTEQKLKAQLLMARHHKLTLNQLIALLTLYHSSIRTAELCKSLNLSPAAMTGIIDKLQALGFARRRRSRRDRRIIKVTITDQGRQLMESIQSPLGWSFVS